MAVPGRGAFGAGALLLLLALPPVWLGFPAAGARAQGDAPEESASAELATIAGDLDDIQSDLRELRDAEPGFEQRLRAILDRSDGLSEDAQGKLARLRQQLTALGVPPAAGDPPEPPEIAGERAAAERTLAQLEAQGRVASFLRVRANQLLEAVALRQRTAVLEVVLMQTPPPWNPAIWRDGLAEVADVVEWLRVKAVAWANWFHVRGGPTAIMEAVAAALGGSAAAAAAGHWLSRRRATATAAAAPPGASSDAFGRSIAAAGGLVGLGLLWQMQGWLDGSFGEVLRRGIVAAVLVILGIAMLFSRRTGTTGLLRPGKSERWAWGAGSMMLLALVVGLLKEAALRQPNPPPALLAVLATVSGVAALALLAPSLPSSAWRDDDPALGTRRALARAGLATLATAPLVLALLGRGVLATYVCNRGLAGLVLVWAVVRLRRTLHALLRDGLGATVAPAAAGAAAPAAPGDEEPADGSSRIARYWAAAVVDIGLALLTVKLLLLLLDVPRAQVDYWTGLALGDVQVGGAVISLPNILLALVVLAAGLFASSRLRLWLAKTVLPGSGMEIGLRTSLAAGVGYLGIALAVLAAVAIAGISLSSVAIVAGALSVGIGFGLRTVVENFVAGLLMLIERPIRVGDWVVIGTTEGTVRRISVRATEIETFDAASVVVPNSLFVSEPVTNWTLQNRRGRLRIKLGVAYGSDTKAVQAALLECARANRQVAAYPAPQALFMELGDSALLFELRCHVRDVDYWPNVRSDLLLAIDQAMRARGVEIPFPQQVVHRGQGWEEAAEELPPSAPIPIRPAS